MIPVLDILMALPSVLSDEVFGSYLDLRHVALVDSAICNSRKRVQLLSVLYGSSTHQLTDLPKKTSLIRRPEDCQDRNKERLIWITLRNLKLKSLSVDPTFDMMADIMAQYLQLNGKFVKSIAFNRSTMQRSVQAVLDHCDCVDTINCEENMNATELRSVIARWAHQLKHISLNIADASILTYIGSVCKQLETINVIFPIFHSKVLEEGWVEFFQTCSPTITSISSNKLPLTDRLMDAIAQYLPFLACLEGDRTTHLTDAGLFSLSKGCPRLRKFSRNQAFSSGNTLISLNITDVGLCAIASNAELTQIELNDVPQITDESIITIAKSCSKLSSLSMDNCPGITNAALIALGTFSARLMHFTMIDSVSITDESVVAMARGCHHLETVTLSSCTAVTDTSLIALAKHCRHIKTFYMSSNKHISDEGISAVARSWPRLQWINFSSSTKITDIGIITIAQHCPLLSKFCLNGANLETRVTAASVTMLAECCPRLTRFTMLSECVSDMELIYLVDHCKNLRVLEIRSRTITLEGIRYVAEHCHYLKYLCIFTNRDTFGDVRNIQSMFGAMVYILNG